MDEQQMLQTSVVVVVGTVTAIESAAPEPGGPIYTYVHIQPERIIKGPIERKEIVLREPGGTLSDRREWTFGAPEFWVGERSLVFLSRNSDGTLQTHSLSMGKFTLGVDRDGKPMATRDFGYGASVLIPASGQLQTAQPETRSFRSFLRRLHRLARAERGVGPRRRMPFHQRPPELDTTTTEVQESYTFLGSPPSRWFEPDSGQPVSYRIDSTGDSKLGFAASQAAIDSALAAWTNVPTSNLVLTDGGTTSPSTFSGCDANKVLFNDPSNEVTDPSSCRGVLAIGGFCGGSGTTVVNGTTFYRITIGKVMFNNGWGGCSFWNQCNVAEVATHEIGHTIGLGHSADSTATMAATAHFDGRCASLKSDDVAGVSFIYPQNGTPLPAPTFFPQAATPTPTRTPTRTPSPAPTWTRTATTTPTATRPPTQTATRPPSTATATPFVQLPTRTPTATFWFFYPTRTPTPTFWFLPTRTPTATFGFSTLPTRTPTPIYPFWWWWLYPTSTPTRVP